MSIPSAKQDTTELPLIYMNGSRLSVSAHELVSVLRSRTVFGFVLILLILLALPESRLAAEVPLWARILLAVFSGAVFIEVLSAAITWVSFFATNRGWRALHIVRASIPTAMLVAILTETAQLLLLGLPIERPVLLAKILIAVVFWETVIFVLLWFYIPALARQAANTSGDDRDGPDGPTILLGGKRIAPVRLRRIETAGRLLHLHIDEDRVSVTAKMRDVQEILARYGLAVHRCHWVAFTELGPIRREGRTLMMTTRSGDPVPVSRERRKDVEALRNEVGAP